MSNRQLLQRALNSAICNEEALIDAYSHIHDDEAKALKKETASFIKQMRSFMKKHSLEEVYVPTHSINVAELFREDVDAIMTPGQQPTDEQAGKEGV